MADACRCEGAGTITMKPIMARRVKRLMLCNAAARPDDADGTGSTTNASAMPIGHEVTNIPMAVLSLLCWK